MTVVLEELTRTTNLSYPVFQSRSPFASGRPLSRSEAREPDTLAFNHKAMLPGAGKGRAESSQ